MRKKYEARFNVLEERLFALEENPTVSPLTEAEYLWTRESRTIRNEVKDLRNLLDEIIEPGYVLKRNGGASLSDWISKWLWVGLHPSKPVTYEIRHRISDELIATFQNRHDADVFIESLDGETIDETGEEASE